MKERAAFSTAKIHGGRDDGRRLIMVPKWMFYTLCLALVVMGILLLTGCSAISSGYITKKTDEPSYSYTSLICAGYGKYGCTVYVPIVHTVPERFKLDLKNKDQTGWVYVPKQVFNDVKVGEVYNGR